MEDNKIIELYFNRDEKAIEETELKYGTRLYIFSKKILKNHEDAEEAKNDTYLAAWNSIPPEIPKHFYAYLLKICRNFAFGIVDRYCAQKRSADIFELTGEMEACIPDKMQDISFSEIEIGMIMSRFLSTLTKENRIIFLRRYFFYDQIAEISALHHISASKVKTSLHRTRKKLREFLESEGIHI